MPPLLWLLWLRQKPRHHPLRPTKRLKTFGLLTVGRTRLRPLVLCRTNIIFFVLVFYVSVFVLGNLDHYEIVCVHQT